MLATGAEGAVRLADIRLIALDLDGTLVHDSVRIPPRNREAVARAQVLHCQLCMDPSGIGNAYPVSAAPRSVLVPDSEVS